MKAPYVCGEEVIDLEDRFKAVKACIDLDMIVHAGRPSRADVINLIEITQEAIDQLKIEFIL